MLHVTPAPPTVDAVNWTGAGPRALTADGVTAKSTPEAVICSELSLGNDVCGASAIVSVPALAIVV